MRDRYIKSFRITLWERLTRHSSTSLSHATLSIHAKNSWSNRIFDDRLIVFPPRLHVFTPLSLSLFSLFLLYFLFFLFPRFFLYSSFLIFFHPSPRNLLSFLLFSNITTDIAITSADTRWSMRLDPFKRYLLCTLHLVVFYFFHRHDIITFYVFFILQPLISSMETYHAFLSPIMISRHRQFESMNFHVSSFKPNSAFLSTDRGERMIALVNWQTRESPTEHYRC